MRKLLLLITIVAETSQAFCQTEYSLEKKLPAIKISYENFWKAISDMDYILKKYDSTYHNANSSFVINNGDLSITISNLKNPSEINLNKAHNLNYQYTNYSGSISKIIIDCDDNNRTINITGQNIIEIQTLLANIESNLIKHRSLLSGRNFRTTVGIILIIISLFMQFVINIKDGKIAFSYRRGLLYVFGLLLFLFVISSTWNIYGFKNLFSGFTIYKDDINFITKYADYFTFFGFCLAIIGIISWKKIFKK